MATAALMHGTWVGAFAEAGGFAASFVWSYRAAMTNPRVTFRLLAMLVFALLTILLAFYLAAERGLA